MDVIWPGFQGIPEVKNGKLELKLIFSDFWGKAPCYLMRYYPLPQQVIDLGVEGLRELSKKHNLKIRGQTINKLLLSANLALIKSPNDLEIELFLLQMKLDDLERANQKNANLEHIIELLLVQAPGVILLSVTEIGVFRCRVHC